MITFEQFFTTTRDAAHPNGIAPHEYQRRAADDSEDRFLTIHPFSDFNGRTICLFLRERHRRLDLPRAILETVTGADPDAVRGGPTS